MKETTLDSFDAFMAEAEKVTPVRRRRYPRNQGDAAGEAAEALQARAENRAYRAERNSK